MTTIQLTQQAGLLSPEALEPWLREQLKARRWAEFLSALDKLDAVGNDDYMSPEEVAEEIRAMRAEKRAGRAA